MKAVLASGNAHKARELEAALPGWEIELLGEDLPPEEGSTFYENALAKARFASARVGSGVCVLGEDSGLEVEGLGGRPGIRSARYAGPGASDRDNVAKLLEELRAVGDGRRARYVCELVCLSPEVGEVRTTGTLRGIVAEAPRGSGGFGYDPVFVPEGETRTVAELGDGWKAESSHRARAARALLAAVEARAESL